MADMEGGMGLPSADGLTADGPAADGPSADPRRYDTAAAAETEALGERLGRTLAAGDVVTLSGPLGSGKTTFAKGLARGLEVAEEVTSPTYALVSEYRGRLTLYHVDLYRIATPTQYTSLAMDDILHGPWVTVVEWPEHAAPPITGTIGVTFAVAAGGGRTVCIQGAARPDAA